MVTVTQHFSVQQSNELCSAENQLLKSLWVPQSSQNDTPYGLSIFSLGNPSEEKWAFLEYKVAELAIRTEWTNVQQYFLGNFKVRSGYQIEGSQDIRWPCNSTMYELYRQ